MGRANLIGYIHPCHNHPGFPSRSDQPVLSARDKLCWDFRLGLYRLVLASRLRGADIHWSSRILCLGSLFVRNTHCSIRARSVAGILVGIVLNCVVASLVGVPTLKLRGHYLAMATLGIGEIIHIMALADTEELTRVVVFIGEKLGFASDPLSAALAPYRALTGGPSGFGQIPALGLDRGNSRHLQNGFTPSGLRCSLRWLCP